MKNQSPQIHLWCPNIFEFKGGIQVYCEFLISALYRLYPDASYDIFLKHDTCAPQEQSLWQNTRFHFAGKFPSFLRTLAFSIKILRSGLLQQPNLVITVHVNFTMAAYWLKRLTGIPYWTIAHGVDAWNIENPALQNALHYADRILAVSSYTRDRLLSEQDLDPNKVVILPNTFDSDRFQIDNKPQRLLQRHRLKPEQPIILTIARLADTERYKGYDQVLQALPKIRQSFPDVHYVLAGKGSDRPRIEQLITQLDIQDCVTLAGFVPNDELCDYYNLCDVFAMPSKGEGFGIVYLEALACGKPTLGGNQDGAIDALCHGELGVLVDPNDVEAIACTLTQILQHTYPHPILYQPEILRQRVIDTFGFDRFKKTLDELLQDSPLQSRLL